MAKNNTATKIKTIVSIVGLLALFATIVAGFVTNSEEIEDNYKELTDHEIRIRAVETAVIEQRKDVSHIKETLDRIETKLDK
ncbi:hypothetical protein LCGC14_0434330 [marine sediment metagenome]|uniref:Uncharacterized protein n=1 Tax=marine sediment metagenome TaxID=412755 RepID=A0A0F9VWI6_9ZZZZ